MSNERFGSLIPSGTNLASLGRLHIRLDAPESSCRYFNAGSRPSTTVEAVSQGAFRDDFPLGIHYIYYGHASNGCESFVSLERGLEPASVHAGRRAK